MPLLHLMVGLPGSGKTTRARQLAETHGAVRLTPDEWHIRLFGQDADHPEHDRRHDMVEALMWDVAQAVLAKGVDVILDFGFWSRAERLDFRARAASLGADTMVHYADIPFEDLLVRIARRNADQPAGSFVIRPEALGGWLPRFEPPQEDELGWGRQDPTRNS